MVSIPATMIRALQNDLKHSIGRVIRLMAGEIPARCPQQHPKKFDSYRAVQQERQTRIDLGRRDPNNLHGHYAMGDERVLAKTLLYLCLAKTVNHNPPSRLTCQVAGGEKDAFVKALLKPRLVLYHALSSSLFATRYLEQYDKHGDLLNG